MKHQRRIILASASPRRKELLEKIGLSFEVDAGNCREDLSPGLEPRKLAAQISLEKAQSVAGKYPDALIIGADTFGVLDDRIIGKPGTAEEARTMLESIGGKCHLVITGYSIIDTACGKTVSATVETKVYIKELAPEEIDAYVKTGEPLDKAGAYAIQGLGALLVKKIEGDYFNVVGLPVYALMNDLKEFGISVF
jgi:septum formation protein